MTNIVAGLLFAALVAATGYLAIDFAHEQQRERAEAEQRVLDEQAAARRAEYLLAHPLCELVDPKMREFQWPRREDDGKCHLKDVTPSHRITTGN